MPLREGSCACGVVKVQMPLNDRASLCYCTDCRMVTGGTYTYSLECKMFEFSISSSEHVKVHTKVGEGGSHVNRWFCTECGSNIYVSMGTVPPAPEEEVFPYGGLFPPLTLPSPQTAVWTKNLESWDRLPETVVSKGYKQENITSQTTREKTL